tara:strand:- start:7927 stop:8163 length:237 start_codon:yes stop_codon:yes gene_type:complete
MKLPFSFAEFVKNPFAAIALLCIVGMGYLYIDARSAQEDILENCRHSEKNKIERITKLEKDVADLQTKIIELATMEKD